MAFRRLLTNNQCAVCNPPPVKQTTIVRYKTNWWMLSTAVVTGMLLNNAVASATAEIKRTRVVRATRAFVVDPIASITAPSTVSTWNPKGTTEELMPIAYMESYNGKYTNHEPHSKGRFHTAVGAMGLKPVTGWDTYIQSEKLRQMRPDLTQEELTDLLHTDIPFYNAVCNSHWKILRKLNPTLERAVYSWRWGYGAAQKASDEEILSDSYVSRYFKLGQQGLIASAE